MHADMRIGIMPQDPPDDSNSERRDVLQTLGAAPFALPFISGGATAATQPTTITLGVRSGTGFEGLAPEAIRGTTNPTLTLKPDQPYRLTVKKLDRAPHTLTILDDQGSKVKSTGLIPGGKGTTRTLEGTATNELANYRCNTHPNMGRGAIEVGTPDGPADWELTQRLTVHTVEPGWIDAQENWESAGTELDADETFDVRVDVSGVESTGDTTLVSMAVPRGPNGEFGPPHADRLTNVASGGSISYVHGTAFTDAFAPDTVFTKWTEGDWQIYVVTFDSTRHAYGTGVSQPITIQ